MTHSLKLARHVPLTPELAFALWTDASQLETWWGPKDENGAPFTAEIIDWTAKPGSPWRIRLTAPDGTRFEQGGEMIEVSPPRLLRFSFHWIENGQKGPTTQISVQFDPDGDGTRVSFEQAGFADAATRDSHETGWQECLDRLAVHAGAAS